MKRYLITITFILLIIQPLSYVEARESIGDREAVNFIKNWLKLSQDNANLDRVMLFYADTIDFHRMGKVKRQIVRADKEKYYRRWPKRKYTITSIKVNPGVHAGEKRVELGFHYKLVGKKQVLEGDVRNEIILKKEAGKLYIISEKGSMKKPEQSSIVTSTKRKTSEVKPPAKQRAGEAILKCSLEEHFDSGAWRDTKLTLMFEGRRIIKISYTGGFASGREGGGGGCFLDLFRTDGQSAWDDQGNTIIIEEKKDDLWGNRPKVEIAEFDKGYQLVFTNMQGHCGFHAEFPKSVRLERGNERCVADYH